MNNKVYHELNSILEDAQTLTNNISEIIERMEFDIGNGMDIDDLTDNEFRTLAFAKSYAYSCYHDMINYMNEHAKKQKEH